MIILDEVDDLARSGRGRRALAALWDTHDTVVGGVDVDVVVVEKKEKEKDRMENGVS